MGNESLIPGSFYFHPAGSPAAFRGRNDGGIVRQSALAVLRLMTSSNVVGCWIGSSPGFAPLRGTC